MTLKHGFYSKSKKEQHRIQFVTAAIAAAAVAAVIVAAAAAGSFLLGLFIIPVVLSIVAPFFDTPSLKKRGKLIYRSLLFISEQPKNGVVKIHGGTLFDYVFVLNKDMNGKQRTRLILQQYLEGILHLIEDEENKKISGLTVRGTSYIINERTAKRIGFKVTKIDFIQILILAFNYLNISATYSLAKRTLAFPDLTRTKTFEAQLTDLVERKEIIRDLNNKLLSDR